MDREKEIISALEKCNAKIEQLESEMNLKIIEEKESTRQRMNAT